MVRAWRPQNDGGLVNTPGRRTRMKKLTRIQKAAIAVKETMMALLRDPEYGRKVRDFDEVKVVRTHDPEVLWIELYRRGKLIEVRTCWDMVL
jgi:hypothetical protein